MNIGPLVTVLLPVLNGERWLGECLESLRTQTYQNLEVLLIDDGCTDNSLAIARASGIGRIRFRKGPGQGVAAALAFGVRESHSELIARQDADDVSMPSRIEEQVIFMTRNPEYVACGTWAIDIDEQGRQVRKVKLPKRNSSISLRMCFYSCFYHPSVMFRRSSVIAVGNYRSPTSDPYPEDYDLWSRLSEAGKLANLPRYLIKYRINTSGISRSFPLEIASSADQIAAENSARFLGVSELDDNQRAAISLFYRTSRPLSLKQFLLMTRWIVQLHFSADFLAIPGTFSWKFYASPFYHWIIGNSRK